MLATACCDVRAIAPTDRMKVPQHCALLVRFATVGTLFILGNLLALTPISCEAQTTMPTDSVPRDRSSTSRSEVRWQPHPDRARSLTMAPLGKHHALGFGRIVGHQGHVVHAEIEYFKPAIPLPDAGHLARYFRLRKGEIATLQTESKATLLGESGSDDRYWDVDSTEKPTRVTLSPQRPTTGAWHFYQAKYPHNRVNLPDARGSGFIGYTNHKGKLYWVDVESDGEFFASDRPNPTVFQMHCLVLTTYDRAEFYVNSYSSPDLNSGK